MKRIILSLLPLAASLCAFSLQAQTMHDCWQIGRKDNSAADLAGGPFNYRQAVSQFTKTAVFQVGMSNPAKDFPFVLAGPDDSWARQANRQILIRFGLDKTAPSCKAQLTFNFVANHPHPPLIELRINDLVKEIRVPAGDNQNFFNDRQAKMPPPTVVDLPAGTLKAGNNIISIRSKNGSWTVFDNIAFSTAEKVAVVKPTAGIDIFAASAEPALIYGKNRELLQPATLQIGNWGKTQTVDVAVNGQKTQQVTAPSGVTAVEIGLPRVTIETDVTVSISAKGKQIAEYPVKAFPVKEWTVYLVQHTHTDIGYTKPQTEILAEHIRYIDYAIEYCELTENYPDDAKFRWTCEAAWAVREYLHNRPKTQIDKFLKYIRNGQIEVAAMFFNMAEIADENSYKTFLEPIREFKQLGIPVTTAMQNDVNGIAWCLADYMPDLGIKYFTMGENSHRALIPFNRPTLYKWESPSGKQVYSYRSDHYMTGNGWGIHNSDYKSMAPKVFDYLNGLTRRGYPFDAVSVQYSGYSTDNSPPSMHESDLIRQWNEHYASPRLRSALVHEFLDDVTARYDKQLPVYRMAYPDWWTDGFGSAARETAAARRTHADMITIQGMLAMAAMKGQTLPAHVPDAIRHVHENLLFYDEHTYGAAESIRDPTCDNSEVQWAEKASYAWEALKNAQIMYETSVGLLQGYLLRGENPTITVFNTLNWPRSGLTEVYIDHEIIPAGKSFQMLDAEGHTLKTQYLRSRSEGAYYAVYAENIPPMGYKTYQIVAGNDERQRLPRTTLNANTIENEWFRIVFDPSKGAVSSLIDKQSGNEMVDSSAPWQLGAFVYETLGNRRQMELYKLDDFKRNGLTDIHIEAGNNGPVYQSVFISGKSACCEDGFGVKSEIRLFHHEKRIEFHFTTKKLPITEPDGIYVAFPFKLDGAELLFDVPGGVVSSGKNQLEATANDWNTVQNFVVARNDKMQYIIGSQNIPLFQLGDINTGKYKRQKTYDKPHVYSWVTNNYWTTNFRASQEGELRWSYYLTATADTANTAATQFGWGARVPLYARVMPKGKPNNQAAAYSAFRLSQPNVLVTSATPSLDKGYILLNIRELDGKDTSLQITDASGNALEFTEVNAIEEKLSKKVKQIDLKGFDNKFVKLECRM